MTYEQKDKLVLNIGITLLILAFIALFVCVNAQTYMRKQEAEKQSYEQGYVQGQIDAQAGKINITIRSHEDVWILKDDVKLTPGK